MDFQNYKQLTTDERDFFVFSQLCKIDDISRVLDGEDQKYAGKWVEVAVKGTITTLVGGLIWLFFGLISHFTGGSAADKVTVDNIATGGM